MRTYTSDSSQNDTNYGKANVSFLCGSPTSYVHVVKHMKQSEAVSVGSERSICVKSGSWAYAAAAGEGRVYESRGPQLCLSE